MESAPKNTNELPQEEAVLEEQAILGVNEYLQKEAERTGEKFPLVYIKFFSGGHTTEYDVRDVPKKLEDADIYIPELDGWTEEQAQEFNDLSFGRKELEPDFSKRAVKFKFYDPIFKALSNSRKPVVFIDLPAEELTKWREEKDKSSAGKPILSSTYEEALEKMKLKTENETEFQTYRENYMRAQLGPKIAEVLRENAELQTKEKVTALVTLGAFHTDIYHKLKGTDNESVSRDFSDMPVYPAASEVSRRLMFRKEVSGDLMEKTLLDYILRDSGFLRTLWNIDPNSIKIFKLQKLIEDTLGSGDIREVFEKWKEEEKNDFKVWRQFLKEFGLKTGDFKTDEEWENAKINFEKWREENGLSAHDFSKYFDAKLLEKGIKMPTNEKELDELLAGGYGEKTAKEAQDLPER